MSIWCSGTHIGFDDDDADPDVPDPFGGQVRSYATGWSNHFPTIDGKVERPASIDLATMPAWCAGGADDDFESLGPWARLTVRSAAHNYFNPVEVTGPEIATVVLDEGAAGELVAQLTDWLARPKVRPT